MGVLSVTLNPEVFRAPTPLLFDPEKYNLEQFNADLITEVKERTEKGAFPLFTNRTISLPNKTWQIDSPSSLSSEALSSDEKRFIFVLKHNDMVRDFSITLCPPNQFSYFLQGYLDTEIEHSSRPKKTIDGIVYSAEDAVRTRYQATLKFTYWMYRVQDAPTLSRANSVDMMHGRF
jgi:hypothetical protein